MLSICELALEVPAAQAEGGRREDLGGRTADGRVMVGDDETGRPGERLQERRPPGGRAAARNGLEGDETAGSLARLVAVRTQDREHAAAGSTGRVGVDRLGVDHDRLGPLGLVPVQGQRCLERRELVAGRHVWPLMLGHGLVAAVARRRLVEQEPLPGKVVRRSPVFLPCPTRLRASRVPLLDHRANECSLRHAYIRKNTSFMSGRLT